MVKGKMLHFVAFFVQFDKLGRPHPGPLEERKKTLPEAKLDQAIESF